MNASTNHSSLLANVPGVAHGFGNRRTPIPDALQPDWEKRRPRWHQVHGVDCAEVAGPGQDCGKVDALFSFRSGIPVAVMTADCVPILMVRRSGGAIAAIHAGWRGTRARVLEMLWRELSARGEKTHDWVAAIGPAIGPCCYEVSGELFQDFSAAFGDLAMSEESRLDLPGINANQLRNLGVGEVDLIRACTKCSGDKTNPDFFSYRREGSGTRQYSGLIIK